MTSRKQILFVGIGGQGVLASARILGEAAHRRGISVVVGQLHDMAQRGGAVQAAVTFGTEEPIPLEPGSVDVLVGLEPLEALRAAPLLRPGAAVLCESRMQPPPEAALRGSRVPTFRDVTAEFQRRGHLLTVVDATSLAANAGGSEFANAVMLGALSRAPACPVPSDALVAVLSRGPHGAVNARAFALGVEAVSRTLPAVTPTGT